MMNQRELRAYYEEKARLRGTVLTLDGLREYESQGIPGLAEEIAAMEAAVREKSAELDERAEDVLSTLALVGDTTHRVLLTLHFYRGLQWKETGSLCGLSATAARNQAMRAMRKVIPE